MLGPLARRVALVLVLLAGVAAPSPPSAQAAAVWHVEWSGQGEVCTSNPGAVVTEGTCTVHGEAPWAPFGVLGLCRQFGVENGPGIAGCHVTLDGTLTTGLGCFGSGTGTLTVQLGLPMDPNISSFTVNVTLVGAGAVLFYEGTGSTASGDMVYAWGKITPGCGVGVFTGRAQGPEFT